MSISPFTGYGDDPNTSVKFGLRRINGAMPDWQGGPKLTFHAIVNSDREVSQYHGRTPWTITLRLRFADRAALEAMDALQGRRATLRYLFGLTKRAGGHAETILGTRYLVLPETLLLSLETVEIEGLAGGSREAMATFQRLFSAGVS